MTLTAGRADLWVAALAIVALGLAIAAVVYRASARAPGWVRNVAVAVLVGLLLLFGFRLADSVPMARLLPVTCLPVCGDLAIPLAFPLAALLLRFPLPLWRRILLVSLLVMLALGTVLATLLRPTPTCANSWDDNVCLQTQTATCSAAAAATLLHHYGIAADEEEMARLCLTSGRGTTLHGLFRGLLVKTEGTPYRPRIGTTTVADLQSSGHLPAIVSVALTAKTDRQDARYAKDWGWQIGVSHAVVILAFTDDDRVLMADPSVGQEHWNVGGLRDLLVGDCVWLGKR